MRARKFISIFRNLGLFLGVRQSFYVSLALTGLTAVFAVATANSGQEAGKVRRLIPVERAQALLDLAKPGDVVTVPPGTYNSGLIVTKPIVVNLAGVVLAGVVEAKAILLIKNVTGPVVINDFSGDGRVSHARQGNLAGIRVSGVDFDVTINRARISHTVMGILTDNRGGRLQVRDSALYHMGDSSIPSNLSHIIYAGSIDELIVYNTYLASSHALGHLLKSRSGTTQITDSQILGLNSRHSRVLDLPCGGTLAVLNSTLQSSSLTDNVDMIAIGVEPPENCVGGLVPGNISIHNSILVFDRNGSIEEPSSMFVKNLLFNWRTQITEFSFSGNIVVDPMGSINGQVARQPHIAASENDLFTSRAEAGLSVVENTVP